MGHLRVTELRGVTYHNIKIIQCYLPPDTTERAQSNPIQTRLTYPGGIEGWVDLGGWLPTDMVNLSEDSRPS